MGRRLPQLHRQTHRHARALKSSPSNPPRLRLRDADPAKERRERGVERMGVLEQFDGEADRFLREGEDEVGCTSAQQEVPFYSFSGTQGCLIGSVCTRGTDCSTSHNLLSPAKYAICQPDPFVPFIATYLALSPVCSNPPS